MIFLKLTQNQAIMDILTQTLIFCFFGFCFLHFLIYPFVLISLFISLSCLSLFPIPTLNTFVTLVPRILRLRQVSALQKTQCKPIQSAKYSPYSSWPKKSFKYQIGRKSWRAELRSGSVHRDWGTFLIQCFQVQLPLANTK